MTTTISTSTTATTTTASSTTSTTAVVLAATITTGVLLALSTHLLMDQKFRRRHERAKWVEKARVANGSIDETLPSIIEQFRGYKLTEGSTIEEANKRRTTSYYEKARHAHNFDLVLGVKSYPRLRNRREVEMARILKQYRKGNQSHRTVIVMCDSYTSQVLLQAREEILGPLNYTTNIATERRVWIPHESLIPETDMHVTIAIPWWWHTIRDGNEQLTRDLVARFRQALLVGFHHPFQIELERIVLLGGKALVALWRCVGDRETEDGSVIYDRHGSSLDPMARLRSEIVRCFTCIEGAAELGGVPLTYSHRKLSMDQAEHVSRATTAATTSTTTPPPVRTAVIEHGVFKVTTTAVAAVPVAAGPPHSPRAAPRTSPVGPPPLVLVGPSPARKRSNSIEDKTPGLGDADGFIHTTLARLPLDCLSMNDVELGPIHRLCREATATYCGHRMVISKFRFLETIGAGGESNPCVNPIFDETVAAPPRVGVSTRAGGNTEHFDLHARKLVVQSATIGAPEKMVDRPSVHDLFDPPMSPPAR
jgi:hypothetical protein